MSDQATSGEQVSAPATSAGAAPTAATPGDDRPIGAFGTARGSGLARGKRANTPAATPSATPAGNYKPTAIEVITPQREYTNPFASATPATVPANEPAPQAENLPAPEPVIPAAPVATATPAPEAVSPSIEVNGPVTTASEPPAVTAPAAGEPTAAPAEIVQPSVEKAEIKILPPAEAKRPAVSWGAGSNESDTRPQREPRATFQPDRRDRRSEPREPRSFEPREPRSFEGRGAQRDPGFERGPRRDRPAATPAPAPEAPKQGGFVGWLKGLFGGKPAAAQPTPSSDERQPHETRDGEFHRRRHRGGRGRGGYQGDDRGPRDSQPRDPSQGGRPDFQSGDASQGGERHYEGGGRRRRRGGRGRYRDDRGPRPEGQQGGGAI